MSMWFIHDCCLFSNFFFWIEIFLLFFKLSFSNIKFKHSHNIDFLEWIQLCHNIFFLYILLDSFWGLAYFWLTCISLEWFFRGSPWKPEFLFWFIFISYFFNHGSSSLLHCELQFLFLQHWKLKTAQLLNLLVLLAAVAASKSLQSCPTLCDPIDSSPPGFSVHGILQARTLEWVAISSSNAWKWKVKMKLLCRVRLLATPWTAAYQAPPSMGFSRQEYWSRVPLP